MKKIAPTFLALLLLAGCSPEQPPESTGERQKPPVTAVVDLSPAVWPAGEYDRYIGMEDVDFPGNPEAIGEGGAISGSYNPAGLRAGLEALAQGGSSVDAALTASMAQITLNAGAVVSFFGIMSLVHYDAATGEIEYMNAGWNTVAGENDPMGVPGEIGGHGDALYGTGDPSGRTALVGGFMRGVESAHARFGKLPFESLFAPSIYFAEQGFPVGDSLADALKHRKDDLTRLPASKAVFVGPDGEWLEKGDTFYQPALAKTLRSIQAQGVDYLYTGPWAAKAIAAIQADGGKMTMEDLASYEVTWAEALSTDYNGYTVYVNGLPSYGGANMLEALNMGESAELLKLGHWSENPESLRRVAELTGAYTIPFIEAFAPQMLKTKHPDLDFSASSRITQEHADNLWADINDGNGFAQWADTGYKHSNTVVAIDRWGNMSAIVHSINCVVWGKTAIIVDGVSIGDPLVNQKAIVAKAGPGNRLPDPTEAGIVMKDGEPVLAFSSMAMGLHQETFQSMTNVLGFGMSPKEALDAPSIFMPQIDVVGGDPSAVTQIIRVMDGEFPDEVLEATGLPVKKIPAEERRFAQGLWVGIARDPESGELNAASHPYTNGQAFALP